MPGPTRFATARPPRHGPPASHGPLATARRLRLCRGPLLGGAARIGASRHSCPLSAGLWQLHRQAQGSAGKRMHLLHVPHALPYARTQAKGKDKKKGKGKKKVSEQAA
jgi:hypothetical protein